MSAVRRDLTNYVVRGAASVISFQIYTVESLVREASTLPS